ncbi:RHS repeat-associated core domain-containing protein [Aliidiomarina sanyensis]|uniref:RHS repeat-associated core domain-containing protein n=1 Tax=Aliidiomarina sanyensis TaxID=1249555 RepID=UPI001F54231E|nr:RHS repeat-associated core domain-containing protein [Aliidiomarina sanyensis]
MNGNTIYSVYDRAGALVHLDAVNAGEKADYIAGPQGTLARIKNNVITYLHHDILGSAQSGTNSSGVVQWREQYSPFGEELQGISANAEQAGYTGHIRDAATGLNYMQARYYDPVIGRFYSNDPVGFTPSNPMMFNRYAYANNNPYKFVDPDGREVRAIYYQDSNILTMRDRDTKERISIGAISGGKPYGDPIPPGRYAILYTPREDFFRLEPMDSKFGDDKHDATGRTEFRLHRPGLTIGCIAAEDWDGWGQVKQMLDNTSTTQTTVDSKSRNPFADKQESSTKFGELKVVEVSGRIESQRLKNEPEFR